MSAEPGNSAVLRHNFLFSKWTTTDRLHRVSYDMHAQLATELALSSYREISTLSVSSVSSSPLACHTIPWLSKHVRVESLGNGKFGVR